MAILLPDFALKVEALEAAQEFKKEHDHTFEIRFTIPTSREEQFLRAPHLAEQ